MFRALFILGAIVWAAWKFKGVALIALLLLFLGACSSNDITVKPEYTRTHKGNTYHTNEYFTEDGIQIKYTPADKAPRLFAERQNKNILHERLAEYRDSKHMSINNIDADCNIALIDKVPSPFTGYPENCFHYPNGNVRCDWYLETIREGTVEARCYEAFNWSRTNCQWEWSHLFCHAS